jgi:phage FluMu gp28-like protein
VLDEFAFHQDARAIYQAIAPSIARGYTLEIISTPNGQQGVYYDLAKPSTRDAATASATCSPLELRDQTRQGFRLLIRGEVTARQPLDLEPEFAEPFLREVDLPMLEGIFVAAAH